MSSSPSNTPRSQKPAVRYLPLLHVLAAVAVGILADHYRPMPLAVWWGLAAVSLVAWRVLWRRGWLAAGSLVVLAASASVAGAWHHCSWSLFSDDDLGRFAVGRPQPVCIEAIALKTPRLLPPPEPNPMRVMDAGDQMRFEIEARAIRDGADWRPASGKARIMVSGRLEEIQAGDRLRIVAHLVEPPRPLNPGEFDMAAHARTERICGQLRVEFPQAVERLALGSAWSGRRILEQMRMGGSQIFARWLDSRRSGLASAAILGAREQLEPERTAAFVQTGTIHLLVISGMNLGLLAAGAALIARRLPISRPLALLGVALFAVLYALIVDVEPPVVRATVLVVVTCGATGLGRGWPGFNALALAALVVLALNPCDLFHTGAQLSFLCVAILIGIVPRWTTSRQQDPLDRLIESNFGWSRRAANWTGRQAWKLALISTVVWLLTLPLVMTRFHLMTPISIPMNLLVSFPMTVAFVCGFFVLVLGAIVPPLAFVFAVITNASLTLIEWMVQWGQAVPCGHLWVPGPAEWWLTGFYAAVGLAAAFPRLRPARRWAVALLAGWIALGFAVARLGAERGRLQCTFLAVGHGEAVLLELPNGQTVLYDAGQMGAPTSATRTISGYLWSRGLTHLDAVILSHGDMDHYNALPGLLERFTVGVVYVPPLVFDGKSDALAALQAAIHHAGTPIREISAGDHLEGGPDCQMEVLHPPRRGVLGPDNANSLVLAVVHAGRRLLLTGDLESPGLDDVLAEEPLPCDIVLVPHHGSRASNPAGMAAWARPRWAVISASNRWDLQSVEKAYEESGARVVHTADSGAITATIDAHSVRIAEFRTR